jgi:hypothetical protein
MKKREKKQNMLVTGEISQPQFSNEVQKGVALLFHSDQQSLVRSGAAQLISDEGKAYPVVVRRVLSDKLIVAGISLEQAQILTTFRQHIGPQITTFVAAVSRPFSSPTITRGFVEFRVHPLVQGPLYNGASADVEDTQGNVYPVVVRSIGHIRPDLSSNSQWDANDFQLTVDKITLEQAQTMRKLTRTTGPEENTFVATVLDAQGNLQLPHHIDLNVQVLQHGLLYSGEAQGVSKGGEAKSIVIHAIQATPSVSGSGRLLITVEGISLAQSRELQTLVQDV